MRRIATAPATTASIAGLIAGLLVLSIAGCNVKVLTPGPSDRLREENDRLEADVASLRRELEEMRSKLASPETTAASMGTDPEAVAAMPRLAAIEIAGSSVLKASGEGRGILMLRLVPLDGRGRFLQITGRVSIRASVLPREATPRLVGERSYAPSEVRDAWRSGFFGTVYLFEVPVEIPVALRSIREATVLATFHDAVGGGEYSRLELVPIAYEDRTMEEGSP